MGFLENEVRKLLGKMKLTYYILGCWGWVVLIDLVVLIVQTIDCSSDWGTRKLRLESIDLLPLGSLGKRGRIRINPKGIRINWIIRIIVSLEWILWFRTEFRDCYALYSGCD